MRCDLCPLLCDVEEGKVGKCRVRGNVNGKIELLTYGLVTTAEVGPVEQKPFYHFHPGMKVLSIGGSGCNLACKYCQNYEISQVMRDKERSTRLSPEEVVEMAKAKGARGVAFTYSEPFVWYEFVMDVARAAREAGLKTLLKTAGFGNEEAFSEMCRRMDAVNVDVKGTAEMYKNVCGIDLDPDNYYSWNIIKNLAWAAAVCHVEVSTIAIPSFVEDEAAMRSLFNAIEAAAGKKVPIHVLKFIPDFKMMGVPPTSDSQLAKIANFARRWFQHVYVDFNLAPTVTSCLCGAVLARRLGIELLENSVKDGKCPKCGLEQNFVGC